MVCVVGRERTEVQGFGLRKMIEGLSRHRVRDHPGGLGIRVYSLQLEFGLGGVGFRVRAEG